jgi:hypothetical protein
MSIPKNIFFYWDGPDIPEEVINNVNDYKINNDDYNVKILNNEDINKYKNEFNELIELFHLATISALKSDIIRFIVLYKEGGMWIDSNTTLINKDGIKILYDRYKNFDFITTILPDNRNDLKTSALISKPNSGLAYDTIIQITKNLKNHYEIEKKNKEYVPYNFFLFSAPVVFFDLLDYKFEDRFRNKYTLEFIKDNNNNIITLNYEKFNKYKCGLMDVNNILKFYGCNQSHHHEKNFHKHWSNLQKSQKLFKIIN